jgi:hypothetical protein
MRTVDMMTGHERFELRFAPTPGSAAGSDTVVVHRTRTVGPGGHPVYTDDSGIIRAEISDRGEVRMLPTTTHQNLRRPVACRSLAPLPPSPAGRSATA